MVHKYFVCLSITMYIRLSKLNGVVICDEYHMPISMLMDLESNNILSRRFQVQLNAPISNNTIRMVSKAIPKTLSVNNSNTFITILFRGRKFVLGRDRC